MLDRDALAKFCAHGGRVSAARAVFGGDEWIDLSTGIAPWAWPADAIPAGLDRLPEPDALAALEAAAARAFGLVDAACVAAVPGTDLAMRSLARLIGGCRPAVLRGGYAGHRAAWPGAADVADSPAAEHDLFVLASPANPDGRIADPAELIALADRMTILVDEAYADPAPGLCPHASDRLIVLRSFGKFYGLPGLRLGFVIAGRGVAARLRGTLGDWPVSSPAVAIGGAAYRDVAWQRAQQARIAEAGALLDALLARAALPIVGAAPLFRLIAWDDAARLFEALGRRAILTRPFADRPDRLRIGLPRDAAALTRLASAIEEFRS
ncbi:MAG TPA: aminotransferase class I/II-fold pyridoxal phosphate-dependent enzyme [Sphingomonas sp.]|jgi:cobalamin biosynthetic protein CobC|nr:aminotransferase class I/II-fold pyridoxal phosphate-dependent enzyme [Sphingomonas sp.]